MRNLARNTQLESIADYITFIHKGQMILSEQKDTLLESHCILHCGVSELEGFDCQDVIYTIKENYECRILMESGLAHSKYSGFMVEKATLQDIMFFYCIGGKK